MEYVIEKNDNSEIVKEQKESEYNLLTSKKFDLETEEGKKEKEMILSLLGADTSPVIIQIYPQDFAVYSVWRQYRSKHCLFFQNHYFCPEKNF